VTTPARPSFLSPRRWLPDTLFGRLALLLLVAVQLGMQAAEPA